MSLLSDATLIAGRYRLDRQVATDRSGEVWRGTDVELARPVAVKFLRADAEDDEAIGRFRAAACRAASVAHEGLVRVFDYCEPEPPKSELPQSEPPAESEPPAGSEPSESGPSDFAQRAFLVMEYVDGQLLAHQLHAGPLGAARTVDIVAQVSVALQAVHGAGLAHGDIRPEKILVSHGGTAKLFGFSGMGPADSAAISADLRALGVLALQCLGESGSPDGSGEPSCQVPASVAELIAGLCAHPSADDADGTTTVARQADALRAWLAPPSTAENAAPSASQPAAPHSTQPLPRIPGRAARQARRSPALLAGRAPRKRRSVVAVRGAAIIAFALLATAVYGAVASKPSGTAPGADDVTKAASVRVNAERLVGQPVKLVRLRLQRLGLVVRLRWRSSDSVAAGHVIAVRPAGLVRPHSLVVVVGSSGPSATGTAPDAGQAPTTHRPRPAKHRHASGSPTPRPSRSPSGSPSPAPSPSPSSSPAPSSSPTGSPSPPPSSSPAGSPPPSSSPPPPDTDRWLNVSRLAEQL